MRRWMLVLSVTVNPSSFFTHLISLNFFCESIQMDHPKFVIEPLVAQSSGLTLPLLLPSLAASARPLARPPISNFHVAAVAAAPSGRIFVGVNLEFPGLPLHYSVHAEQFLVTNLFLNAESHLDYLAVSATPCGHCRQFLQEIRGAPDIKLLIPNQEFTPLSQFLSHPFGPHDLLPKDTPLLLEPRHNGLSFSTSIPNAVCCDNVYAPTEKLKYAALEAANKSHAPYSGSPSGVALMDSDGKIYKGSYMESAAYNPSMGPVQAALVAYVAGGGGQYDRIVGAVLVEKEGAVVKQEHTAKLLLHTISSQCKFNAFPCTCSNHA